jgi:hypothetical protein
MTAKSTSAPSLVLPSAQRRARARFPAARLATGKVGFGVVAAAVDIVGIGVAAVTAYALTPYEASQAIDLADRIALFASIMTALRPISPMRHRSGKPRRHSPLRFSSRPRSVS